jgi:Zn-dependent protease
MASPPAFRLFGFPVHVRIGFIVFLVLVVFLYGGSELGVWLAVFLAVFTLLHELGHAVAARATGATAEIALDFFYGYAAFVPTRPLRRWERAGISFAGPATQIVLSCALLLAMGVNPLSIDSVREASFQARALWWAGPVIGVINLAPIVPFDGGNIVESGLDWLMPARSRIVMLWVSIVLTCAAAAWMFTDPLWRPNAIFVMLPLIAQLQMLSAYRARQARVTQRASLTADASLFAAAEANAWRHGSLEAYQRGQQPSPWLRAHVLTTAGDPVGAKRVLLESFAETSPRWAPPDAAPPTALEPLVALLPEPLPVGHPYAEHVLAGVLLRLGDYRRAAHYAADSYTRHRRSLAALDVARAAAALEDRGTALAWLRTAFDGSSPHSSLRHHVLMAPELDHLRADPEFAELLAA